MTISTTASRISHNGNGVTTGFAFPYRFFTNSDLVVVKVSSTGTDTTLVLNTDYTVTGADDDAGGTVTCSVAPASGERLVIYRDMSATQEVDYVTGDAFPAETHERALDRLTMLVQQIDDGLSRSMKVSETSTTTPDDLIDSINASVASAATSATAASDSADAAAASATAASDSADAAAASAASISYPISVANGGTGQTTASAAFEALKQDATTSATGVVELATSSEAQAGTDAVRVLTPSTLKSAQIQIGTAVTSTSGTAIDFTGIPSWAKRITVMFYGVSTSGSSNLRLQIGAGSVLTTGYNSTFGTINGGTAGNGSDSSGFALGGSASAASTTSGAVRLNLLGSNTWVLDGSYKNGTTSGSFAGGDCALAGTLDRIRITTVNGTDTFDAGSINISWE